jgi:hypothetical protein
VIEFSIDINTSDFESSFKSQVDTIERKISKDGYIAFEKTVEDVKNLIQKNMWAGRNANNEVMDKEQPSTIKRKGFSRPLVDSSKMYRGMIYTKKRDNRCEISFTEKAEIYSKLHNRQLKNWQVLKVTDYLIQNALRMFKKNYGG